MTLFLIFFSIAFIFMWIGSRKSLQLFLIEPLLLNRKYIYTFDFFILFSTLISVLVRIDKVEVSGFITWILRGHYLLMGLMWLLCLFIVLHFIMRKIPGTKKLYKNDRRDFLKKKVALFGLGSIVSATTIGAIQSLSPELETVDVELPEKFKKLKGLKIIQLSDIHIGPSLKKDFFDELVKRSNDLSPDIVVITGDMIDGRVADLSSELVSLSAFKSRLGVYYITGNHEYYWNGLEWIDFVKSKEVTVLENAHKVLNYNGQQITMAGVYDLKATRFIESHICDPKKALENSPLNSYKILLAHQPLSCKLAENLNIDLQLSGHTHGGQGFPWNFLVGLVQPYLKGMYNHKGMKLYVNRGTGFWGPPYRLGIPGEITLLKFS